MQVYPGMRHLNHT